MPLDRRVVVASERRRMHGIDKGNGTRDFALGVPPGAHRVLAPIAVLQLHADRRTGVGNGEGEIGQARGDHLHEPATLALAPDADPCRDR